MFGSLFAYPKVLARHQAGPVAEERDRYLVHRAREGIARATLRRVAAELLIVARWIDLSHGKRVTLQDIDAVFVTVEPNGGSHHPSGKQLLFAYLRVGPNHP